MKATDLMLGDYVQFFNENLEKTQYEKVTSIKIDDGTRYIQTAESDVYYREEIYKPILIKEEFLNDNCIKHFGDYWLLCESEKSRIDINRHKNMIDNYTYKVSISGNGLYATFYLTYVHSLQHVLRMYNDNVEFLIKNNKEKPENIDNALNIDNAFENTPVGFVENSNCPF